MKWTRKFFTQRNKQHFGSASRRQPADSLRSESTLERTSIDYHQYKGEIVIFSGQICFVKT